MDTGVVGFRNPVLLSYRVMTGRDGYTGPRSVQWKSPSLLFPDFPGRCRVTRYLERRYYSSKRLVPDVTSRVGDS